MNDDERHLLILLDRFERVERRMAELVRRLSDLVAAMEAKAD